MATIEQLFVEIFDRKKTIIEHVKHQIDLFDHHLASKCLLDGIPPPPWLFPSLSSDSDQLKKEELISGLLLPRPQSVNFYPSSCYSPYRKPFDSVDNLGLPDAVFTEAPALKKGIDIGGVLCDLPKFPSLDRQCTFDSVLKQDVIVASPQEFVNAGISDIFSSHAQSLISTQRTKSNEDIDAGDSNGVVARDVDVTSTQDFKDAGTSDNCYDHAESSVRAQGSKLNKDADARGGLSELSQIPTFGLQYTLQGVLDQDFSDTSPQDYTNAGTSDNFPDHAQSLARMQRSKSRQRALQLRNSAKPAKTYSCNGYNTDPCTSRIIGAGITLQYDHADDLVLAKPHDANTEICVEEEAGIGECEVKVEDSDISCDRTMRCRNSSQQTSSMNEARNVDSSSYVAKKDGFAESIKRIDQQPNHANESSENFHPSVTARSSSAAKEANMCQRNIYSGRITRSRSSRSCMKENRNASNSSNAAKKDGLAESIRITQQPNLANQLSELLDPSVTVKANSATEEASMGDCTGKVSNNYSGSIIRSRSSSHQPKHAKGPLDAGNSYRIANEGNRLEEPMHRSAQQPDYVSKLSELVKPSSVISNGSSAAKKIKVGDNSSVKKGSEVYSGRMTRSRSSSRPPSSLSKSLMVDSVCGVDMEDGYSNLKRQPNPTAFFKELGKPFDLIDESCQLKAKDLQRNEERNDASCERTTSSGCSSQQLDNVNGFSRVDTASNTGKDDNGTLEQSLEPPLNLKLDAEDGVDLQKVLETGLHVLPCDESRDIVDLRICDAVVAETDLASDGLIRACSVSAGSRFDDSSLGMDVLVSRLSTESVVPSKLEQTDFCGVDESSLNEAFDHVLDNKQKEKSTKEQDYTSLRCVDMMDTVMCTNYQDKPFLSVEMPLLGQKEISINEEKLGKNSSEAHLKACALLMDESTFNPVQQKRISTISGSQNADTLFMCSWPQHKRIKRRNQLIDALSISPSLPLKPSQSILTNHVELCLDGRNISADAAFTLMNEQLDVPSVSGPTKLAAGVSRCHLLEEDEVADPISIVFGAKDQHTAEEKQVMLQLKDGFQLGSTECLPNSRVTMQERISEEGNGNLSYCSVGSLHGQSMDLIGADKSIPELERFVMETDNEQLCVAGKGINNYNRFNIPNTALERASVLEQLCKSACLDTPLSHFSTTYQLHKTLNLYQSTPKSLLEDMELRSMLRIPDDNDKQHETSYNSLHVEVNHAFQERSHYECLPYSGASSAWDASKTCMSPFAKPWDGITSKSGSSEKRASSIPELPSINEENDNIDEVIDTFEKTFDSEVMTGSVKREPLTDITEDPNHVASICETDVPGGRFSFASVNTEISFGTCNKARLKLRNQNSSKRRYDSKAKENQNASLGANGVRRGNESFHKRFSKPKLSGKTSFRKGGPSISVKGSNPNNIVSNITSFIPLVQQKQAAAVITGKRDIKVKALEAAEAAKRLAEKKENERKMKKEALRLERARMEEENLRQLELEKERKDVDRKKKEADMAAKKRQREGEQRKERERKRKRVEEAKKQQQEHEEKLNAEKEIKRREDERAHEKKGLKNKSGKHEKIKKLEEDNNLCKVPETEPITTRISTIDSREAGIVAEACEGLSFHGDNSRVVGDFCKSTKSDSLISSITQEPSYEISPYKGSDDEDDDDDDDIPNSKFIPSWASKNHVALVVASQQKVDPESIFPPQSFCNITEDSGRALRREFRSM